MLWSTQSKTLVQSVKQKLDVFLEFSCFFYDSTDVGNLICGSSAFSKSSLCIWKFSVHVLLKPSLKGFKHYLVSKWNERNCAIVWTLFGICPFWRLEWKLTFSSPVTTPEFPIFPFVNWMHVSFDYILLLTDFTKSYSNQDSGSPWRERLTGQQDIKESPETDTHKRG